MNPKDFQAALSAKHILLSDTQLDQFKMYFEFLVAENQKMNLTALTSQSDVYLKHFYDSLSLAFYDTKLQTEPITVCDVGAGAGFPSIPLKIAFPQLKITIVDSLQKRIGFLQALTKKLQLSEVTLIHSRAEDFGKAGQQFREQFDLVTARAVAPLNVLAEFCLPLAKVGGEFMAMKAAQTTAEVQEAAEALTILGGGQPQIEQFALPNQAGDRYLIRIGKVQATPAKYPRKAGTPSKKPIINS